MTINPFAQAIAVGSPHSQVAVEAEEAGAADVTVRDVDEDGVTGEEEGVDVELACSSSTPTRCQYPSSSSTPSPARPLRGSKPL